MQYEKRKEYLETRALVRDLYRNSKMKLSQIARLCRISTTKTSKMIDGEGEPKWLEEDREWSPVFRPYEPTKEKVYGLNDIPERPRAPNERVKEGAMEQFTKKFRTRDNMGKMSQLDRDVNEFMEEWRKENERALVIVDVYTVYDHYPGDGKSVPATLVVFEAGLLTNNWKATHAKAISDSVLKAKRAPFERSATRNGETAD